MLDRAVEVSDGSRSEGVWAERLSRESSGDNEDRFAYRVRWNAWLYGAVIAAGSVHEAEAALTDGDLLVRLREVEEDDGSAGRRSERRRRFMIVSGYEVV